MISIVLLRNMWPPTLAVLESSHELTTRPPNSPTSLLVHEMVSTTAVDYGFNNCRNAKSPRMATSLAITHTLIMITVNFLVE